ncbi:AAA family ATPase [Alienimonas sp. DA493]|uniref:AAA family ATPase n=1 Tax=Alienimonas sp. DA493 TaxID=3373605 RepID=UPI0037550BB3
MNAIPPSRLPASVVDDGPSRDEMAERGFLGSVLLTGTLPTDESANLTADDFFSDRNTAVFESLHRVAAAGRKIDLVTVADDLARANRLEAAGGLLHLDTLLQETPHAGHGRDYAAILREHARRRAVRYAVREGANDDPDALAAALAEVAERFPPLTGPADRQGELTLRMLCDVPRRPVRWLWPERLAVGKLNLLAGEPDRGKSFLTCDLAARVTRGLPWPDGRGHAPAGTALMLNAEDAADDTLGPRFDAAGGDPARLAVLEAVKDPGRPERCFDLSRDLPRLDAALDRLAEIAPPRLVVIDPLGAYMGGSDSYKDAEVRGLLAPLARLAERRDVAVVLVCHLNKGNHGGTPLSRITGSGGIGAAARCAWLAGSDPDETPELGRPPRRLLVSLKNNLAAAVGGLAYRISGDDPGFGGGGRSDEGGVLSDEPFPDPPGFEGANFAGSSSPLPPASSPDAAPPRVWWDPTPVETTAAAVLSAAAGPNDRGSTEDEDARCETWLRAELMSHGGTAPSKTVTDAACEAGITENRLRRARKALDVRATKRAFGGGWELSLPDAGEP